MGNIGVPNRWDDAPFYGGPKCSLRIRSGVVNVVSRSAVGQAVSPRRFCLSRKISFVDTRCTEMFFAQVLDKKIRECYCDLKRFKSGMSRFHLPTHLDVFLENKPIDF